MQGHVFAGFEAAGGGGVFPGRCHFKSWFLEERTESTSVELGARSHPLCQPYLGQLQSGTQSTLSFDPVSGARSFVCGHMAVPGA